MDAEHLFAVMFFNEKQCLVATFGTAVSQQIEKFSKVKDVLAHVEQAFFKHTKLVQLLDTDMLLAEQIHMLIYISHLSMWGLDLYSIMSKPPSPVSQLGEVMVSMASNLMLADERVLWMAQREAMACSRIIACLQKIAVYRLATAQAFSLVSPINNIMSCCTFFY